MQVPRGPGSLAMVSRTHGATRVETQRDAQIGHGQEALSAWRTGDAGAGEAWATYLSQQGVSSPGGSRWEKWHFIETWPETFGFNLLEGT